MVFRSLHSQQPNQPHRETRSNLQPPSMINPFTISNKKDDDYKALRIYKESSVYDLLNIMLITTCCTSEFFVDNCLSLYNQSNKLLGKRLTEFMVSNTMGRIYTSGTSLDSMKSFIEDWKYTNVNILTSYSNEAPLELVTSQMLDENAKAYVASIDLSACSQNHYGVAFKCSSLCPLDILKKASSAQMKLRSIYSKGFGNLTETLSAEQLAEKLHVLDIKFTPQDFQEFMSLFFNKDVAEENMDQVPISKFEWLSSMHAFYIRDTNKTNNKILRQLTNFTEEDLIELQKFSQRMNSICERGFQLKQRVLVDAEQSYFQACIDSFAVQYSNIYNKEKPYIHNTFQNYLKITRERLAFEIKRCESLNLPIGAKMVRGAYMVEERRIAKELDTEDPILPTIEDTHENYNFNIEFLMSSWTTGSHMIIASHNEQSVLWGKQLIKKYNLNITEESVSFAQLLGIGDHLTFSLAREGFSVGKMCHFGPLHYMIPFLIRRAQESKQVLASSSLKRRLAIDELIQRVKRS